MFWQMMTEQMMEGRKEGRKEGRQEGVCVCACVCETDLLFGKAPITTPIKDLLCPESKCCLELTC